MRRRVGGGARFAGKARDRQGTRPAGVGGVERAVAVPRYHSWRQGRAHGPRSAIVGQPREKEDGLGPME
jgi:hypothetical protein